MRVRFKLGVGSYFPILAKLFDKTTGPILELGSGLCSTEFLHWSCYPIKRKLVTYEDNPRWVDFASNYQADFHDVHIIEHWDKIDFSPQWAIAFVDHGPIDGTKRSVHVAQLTHADYVLCHDFDEKDDFRYHYLSIKHLFKYCYIFKNTYRHTGVLSNKYNPEELFV
ncbi:hypothetical protein [Methanomethylovorans sp.]|uniref:hypothetical protein n=1 Tax=Methanomethylovorans sp. TaxID=2758717 RepID=UPI00351C8533